MVLGPVAGCSELARQWHPFHTKKPIPICGLVFRRRTNGSVECRSGQFAFRYVWRQGANCSSTPCTSPKQCTPFRDNSVRQDIKYLYGVCSENSSLQRDTGGDRGAGIFADRPLMVPTTTPVSTFCRSWLVTCDGVRVRHNRQNRSSPNDLPPKG